MFLSVHKPAHFIALAPNTGLHEYVSPTEQTLIGLFAM